jgi:hypothetical protein
MADLNIDITNGQQQNVTITLPDTQRVSTVSKPTQTVTVLDKYSIVGLAGSADKNYVHYQNSPSATWTIIHNLGKKPSVTVVDSADEIVYGEVQYDSDNQVTLTFAGAFSGKAYFN